MIKRFSSDSHVEEKKILSDTHNQSFGRRGTDVKDRTSSMKKLHSQDVLRHNLAVLQHGQDMTLQN